MSNEPIIESTKEISVGPCKFVISMLSYAQMQAIMEGTGAMSEMMKTDPEGAGTKAVELRDRTICWSLNNAVKWPDEHDEFGSDTKPFSIAHVRRFLPYPKWGEHVNDLHSEVLKLNGITVKKVGEESAETANQLTGDVSAPDSLQTESVPSNV